MSPEARLLWWAAAAGLDLLGTWLAHPIPGRRLRSENVAFQGSHMLERCRLFLLIALGETVLTMGAAIADTTVSPMLVLTGTAALTITVALWALGFLRTERLALQHLEETRDPVYASRHAGDVLMVMVAGLILVAVANEEVIAHPREHASVLSLLLYGGPILFLAAQSWHSWFVLGLWPRLRLIGVAALVLVGFAVSIAPAYVASILVAASLAILALLDRLMADRADKSI